jgi:hypothetical protein
MDPTLVLAAVTGLDRMRAQLDDAAPRQQGPPQQPRARRRPSWRLRRRALRPDVYGAGMLDNASDAVRSREDRRPVIPPWPRAA